MTNDQSSGAAAAARRRAGARDDVAEAATGLRAVLGAVESGELSAGPDQTAWLRGAVDALDVVAAGSDPVVSESGQ